MGKTSSAVKDRYNKKTYDALTVRLPKGMKDRLREACAKNGDTMNGVITAAVKNYLGET